MTPNVFILDPSPERLEQIFELLVDDHFRTQTFSSTADLLAVIRKQPPDILVLHFEGVSATPELLQLILKYPTLVFSETITEEQQGQLYQQGVRRVVVPHAEKSVRDVALAVRMMIRRRIQLREKRRETLTHGDMQALALPELLQNAMLDRKNLILKIRSGNWEAHIQTFLGHVIKAETSKLTGEDALLKTLQLKTGNFVLRGYHQLRENTTLSASTLASLVEMSYEREALLQFLETHFDGKNDALLFVHLAAGKEVFTAEQRNLIKIIGKNRIINKVILESPYPFLKTLRMLKTLVSSGVISAREKRISPPADEKKTPQARHPLR